MAETKLYDAVVIGVSAGGLAALEKILPALDRRFPVPVFVVQHISPDSDNYLPRHFDRRCALTVKEAEDKENPVRGVAYFAPPNYHLLLEPEKTIALSTEGRVNFSRPSVDVLFETAAEAYGGKLVGVILTGANSDGARGAARIKRFGGLLVVQDPITADADVMPRAAIEETTPDHILPLDVMGEFLNTLLMGKDS